VKFLGNYSKSGGKTTTGSPIKTFGDDMYNQSLAVIPEFFYRETKKYFCGCYHHFVLTVSNWETCNICFSESFESLSEGLQHRLWLLGGVPLQHQTDRLTAAGRLDSNYYLLWGWQRYLFLLHSQIALALEIPAHILFHPIPYIHKIL